MPGGRFRAADDAREKGDGHVGDDYAERTGLAGFQAAGDMVGVVIQFTNGGLDFGAEPRADRQGSGEYVGDGADGNTSQICDLFDGGHRRFRFSWKPILAWAVYVYKNWS